MLLSEYQAEVAKIIDRYQRTDLIVVSELQVDARTPKIGVLRVRLVFVNGLELHVNEYVDARYRLEKLSYSYHCQDSDGALMFRYDNAAHKPSLSFACHKHVGGGEIIAAEPPDFSNLLDEVMELYLP